MTPKKTPKVTTKKVKSPKTAEKKKKKTNWEELKIKYLKGSYESVSDFIKEELGVAKVSSWHRRSSTWWAAEKKEIIKLAQDGAKEWLKEEIAKAYEVPMAQLNKLKKGVFDILVTKLAYINQNITYDEKKKEFVITGDISLQDMEKILKMTKTELGEPSSISESHLGDEEKKILENITAIDII